MQKQKRKSKPVHGRRKFIRLARNIGVIAVLSTAAAGGLAAYKRSYDISHDLSVIGNGTPTIVQIHDPGCRLCQNLRRNVSSVKGEFGDEIQFRIADIHTRKGAALARRHDVPHVTLLLFDGKGDLVTALRGVREPENLRATFRTLL